MEKFGVEIPALASSTFFESYITAAASEQECGDDEIRETMQLIDDLQKPDLAPNHEMILPCFEAWLGVRSAKKAAKQIMMKPFPDVPCIVEKLHVELDIARLSVRFA
jgi:hypothetical protein